MRPRAAFTILLAVLAWCASGCATFEMHELAEVTPWPPAAVGMKAKSVGLSYSFQRYESGAPTAFSQGNGIDQGTRYSLAQLQSSGMISEVRDYGSADLNIKLQLVNRQSHSEVASFITGFTLFLVPSFETNYWQIVALVTDAHGRKLAEYDLTDGHRTWYHLLLLPLSPFLTVDAAGDGCQENLYRQLFVAMNRDGLFR